MDRNDQVSSKARFIVSQIKYSLDIAYSGTSDYFGFNHYTTTLVYPDPDEDEGIYNTDMGLITTVDASWPVTASSWFHVIIMPRI